MRSLFQEETYVIGSRMVRGQTQSNGMPGPKKWLYGKPESQVIHFTSAAARKRCGGQYKNAKPGDVTVVDVYRGCGMRLANEIRADVRREARHGRIDKIRAKAVGLDPKALAR